MELSIEQLEIRVASGEARDSVAAAIHGLRAGLARGANDTDAAVPPRVAVGRLIVELPDDAHGETMGERIAHRVLEEMRNSIRRDAGAAE